MKLIQWPLMSELSHFLLNSVQRWRTWRGRSPPRPILAVPTAVTAHPSTASVPITVLLYNGPLLCGFNVTIKALTKISNPHSSFAYLFSGHLLLQWRHFDVVIYWNLIGDVLTHSHMWRHFILLNNWWRTDRQTDRRTDILLCHSPRLCRASRAVKVIHINRAFKSCQQSVTSFFGTPCISQSITVGSLLCGMWRKIKN